MARTRKLFFNAGIRKTITAKENSHNVFVAIARSILVTKIKFGDLVGYHKDLIELMKLAYANYVATIIIDEIDAGGTDFLDLPFNEFQTAFIGGLKELLVDDNPLKDFDHDRLLGLGILTGVNPDWFENGKPSAPGLLGKIRNIDHRIHLKRNFKNMSRDLNNIQDRIKKAFYKGFKKLLEGWEKSLRASCQTAEKRKHELKERIKNDPNFGEAVRYFFTAEFFQDSYLKRLKNIYVYNRRQLIKPNSP
ncbi:MAG: hypothetical protein KKF46_03555 [Nanoarchaeota archaeon]|nr:hypothetical protein [Nanoarchaeota archaeon]MBU1321411.1 hypothetical protein [Nanoarchaeota archaeon]MBU1597890.1 hypothetical protein [Nanoarchaeota archaeon]MBU2442271.1 hypothetical protein [Nanoarchaeota archaeon]